MMTLSTAEMAKAERNVAASVPIISSLANSAGKRASAFATGGAAMIGTDGSSISSQRAAEMGRGWGGCGSGSGMAGEMDHRNIVAQPAKEMMPFTMRMRKPEPIARGQ